MRKVLPGLTLAGMIGLVSPMNAHDYTAGELAIGHPWSRVAPPSAPVIGGYLSVTNQGEEADRLVAVESDLARKVELHQSAVVDGVARMRPMPDGFSLAPGATLALEPGGSHIMFVQPVRSFQEGDLIPARLVFQKAGAIIVDFRVQKAVAGTPADNPHAGHGTSKP